MSAPSNSQIVAITIAMGIVIALYIYRKTKTTQSTSTKTIYGDTRLIKLHQNKRILSILPPKLALVTDLDHTLFGPNKNETHYQSNQHILRFNDIWCKEYAPNYCVLIYATGRNFTKYQLAVEEWDLLIPDILVTQDGVTIHWFNKDLALRVQERSMHKIDITLKDNTDNCDFLWYDTSWEDTLREGWDQTFAEKIHDEVYDKYSLLELPKGSNSKEILRIGVLCKGQQLAKEIEQYYIKRVNEYNDEHKNKKGFVAMNIHSFTCIERNMKEHNDAYWSAFTPAKAGKGSAIEFLKERLRLRERDIICCGDSGNDISMLSIDGIKSVIVANASDELLRFYEQRNGDENIIKTKQKKTLGVIEGLMHYGPSLLK